MLYAIPTNLAYGEGYRVRQFEDEDKLKSFLLGCRPNEKYMIIEGTEKKYRKTTSIEILETVKKEE
jgi:hypothetical protein